jgi:RIO kinase 1
MSVPTNTGFSTSLEGNSMDPVIEQTVPVAPLVEGEIPGRKQGVPKVSYESNADVQRWLQEHALEEGARPPFNPTFLAGLRDRDWILSSLTSFYKEELITDVVHVVKSGKEATVYCCTAAPGTGVDYLAAKVYRPRMFRSLSNDAQYRESRMRRDESGRVARTSRRGGPGRKSERGRSAQVVNWINYEYETQQLVWDAGADVPRPRSTMGNAVLMDYVGDLGAPAPHLREVRLDRAEARPLFDGVIRNIELFLACDRIHGDLSAFNMLYWEGKIIIIDFAQAVDPRYNPEVYSLLERDVARVCDYFAWFGVQADAGAIAGEMWVRYLGGDL